MKTYADELRELADKLDNGFTLENISFVCLKLMRLITSLTETAFQHCLQTDPPSASSSGAESKESMGRRYRRVNLPSHCNDQPAAALRPERYKMSIAQKLVAWLDTRSEEWIDVQEGLGEIYAEAQVDSRPTK